MRAGNFPVGGGADWASPFSIPKPASRSRITSSLPTASTPNAALLLKTYFPAPNYSAGGFRTTSTMGVGKLDPRTDTVKIDHNLTDTLRLSFVLVHDNIPCFRPTRALCLALPGIRQYERPPAPTANAQANMTLSPRTTNEVSYTIKHFNVNLLLQGRRRSAGAPRRLTINDFFPTPTR